MRVLRPWTGLLPRDFSFFKWALLGATLGLLGVLVWLQKGRLYRLTAIALFVSGVLTLLGLGTPQVMVYAAYGFALSFLLIFARVFPYPADSVLLWVEYAYLLRFQICLAGILALALPLAYPFVPSLFLGVFDARGFTSFVFVVWAAFQLAWTILVTSRSQLPTQTLSFESSGAVQGYFTGSIAQSAAGPREREEKTYIGIFAILDEKDKEWARRDSNASAIKFHADPAELKNDSGRP